MRAIDETHDVTTIVLRDPSRSRFAFVPGQFFTLLVPLDDGEVVPRNYSASNAPGEGELHLTVKTKAGGRASGVVAAMRPGDRLRALGPFGSFTVAPDPSARRRLLLVAGGVGITPLASIARAVLAGEPASEVVLVYGNRRAEDVVFDGMLEALRREHRGRFSIVRVLEQPPPAWEGAVGELDRAVTARILEAIPLARDPEVQAFVCGPDAMREEVVAALGAHGVAADAIHVERFSIGPRAPAPAPPPPADAPDVVTILANGRAHRARARAGATLLELGLAAGAPMPFSCAVGGCGACRVKLVEGAVHVEEPSCLTESERAAGWVLACVGRPSGACTVAITNEGTG